MNKMWITLLVHIHTQTLRNREHNITFTSHHTVPQFAGSVRARSAMTLLNGDLLLRTGFVYVTSRIPWRLMTTDRPTVYRTTRFWLATTYTGLIAHVWHNTVSVVSVIQCILRSQFTSSTTKLHTTTTYIAWLYQCAIVMCIGMFMLPLHHALLNQVLLRFINSCMHSMQHV